MKYLMFAITLLSGTLTTTSSLASDIPTSSSPANGPSYSQMYCSGFVTKLSIPRTNFVLGSKESPHEDHFPGRSLLFLGGPSLVEGQRYSLLRQVDDPNREDSSPKQRKKLSELGALYQEVGWVTVRSVEKGAAVASFDFACDTAIRGDIVVPYVEKAAVAFRSTDGPIKSFVAERGSVSGQIVGSKDFVVLLGTGQIVYTDFGSAKGVKPGDYLFVLRGYSPSDLNKVDRASERLPKGSEPTAVSQTEFGASNMLGHVPERVLGEMLVLSVTPEASTGIIMRSFSEMQLGDSVEPERP